MLKHYITISSQQFKKKTLNQFFYLSSANKNLETCIQVWFGHLKELKQFRGTFAGSYLSKCTLSQKCKISCSLKTTTCSHTIFTWPSFVTKQLLKNKETSSCQ